MVKAGWCTQENQVCVPCIPVFFFARTRSGLVLQTGVEGGTILCLNLVNKLMKLQLVNKLLGKSNQIKVLTNLLI